MNANDDEPAEEPARAPRRGAPANTFVPIMLLVVVLLVIAFLNTNLIEPYTGPRAVADEAGAYVFYESSERDGRSLERTFFLRKTQDGRRYDKAQRVEGTLHSAALLSPEYLVALFPDFFSVYSRPRQLEREWSGAATVEAIGFEPRHLATLRGSVYAFGAAKDGSLRAAKLEADEKGPRRTWKLVPLDAARLDKAAEAPGPDVVERTTERTVLDEASAPASAQIAWASAEDADGTLALLYRLPRGKSDKRGEAQAGVVRLVRFDGTAFVGSRFEPLDADLTCLAATAVVGSGTAGSGGSGATTGAAGNGSANGVAGITTQVLVFGVKRADPDPLITAFALEGSRLKQLEPIRYKKGGLLEDRPAQALATVAFNGRVLLFAQIGGAVRVAVKENGAWGDWVDVARMPTEALALVYLHGGSLLILTVVMVVVGLVSLRRRIAKIASPRELDEATARRIVDEALGRPVPEAEAAAEAPPKAPAPATDGSEHDASIPDRLVAFGIDLACVAGILACAQQAFHVDLSARASDDPTRGIALSAWCTLACIAFLAASEVLTGRTPGKRLLGLEVRDLAGGAPTTLQLLYRNLFRIELIFLLTFIQIPPWGEQRIAIPVPLIALLVMVTSPRTQRPGDVIAGTVVQRVRGAEALGESGEPATAEDEEGPA